MAYRRPLTAGQSAVIVVLWVIFAVMYLWHQSIDLYSVVLLTMSAIVVFYPIIKSWRERSRG